MQAKLPIKVGERLEVVALGNLENRFCCVRSYFFCVVLSFSIGISRDSVPYAYKARYLYPVGYKCKRTLPGCVLYGASATCRFDVFFHMGQGFF